MTQYDTLTGLYNVGYFISALEREIERTRRTGLSTSLIMADMDLFKNVNDTYGHEAGNIALIAFADILRKTLRKIDIPCRYGGEEFTVILPGTPLSRAIRASERLREILENSPLDTAKGKINLTASFGVDSYNMGKGISARSFIEKADSYLLQAKEEGRNRICYDKRKMEEVDTEITMEERSMLFSSSRRKSS
jgi:diguanylate cyclase (GGDEF)-like protein